MGSLPLRAEKTMSRFPPNPAIRLIANMPDASNQPVIPLRSLDPVIDEHLFALTKMHQISPEVSRLHVHTAMLESSKVKRFVQFNPPICA